MCVTALLVRQVYVSLADMASMRDALKRDSLEVEAKLAYVPVDGFVSGLDDQVPYMPIHIYIYIHIHLPTYATT